MLFGLLVRTTRGSDLALFFSCARPDRDASDFEIWFARADNVGSDFELFDLIVSDHKGFDYELYFFLLVLVRTLSFIIIFLVVLVRTARGLTLRFLEPLLVQTTMSVTLSFLACSCGPRGV